MAGVQLDFLEALKPCVGAVPEGNKAREGTSLIRCVIWGQCTWRTQANEGQTKTQKVIRSSGLTIGSHGACASVVGISP